MTLRELRARTERYYRRQAARILFRRPFRIKSLVPIISFTFDDFPRSAFLIGGAILKQFGLTGTYYASLSLMGRRGRAGLMYLPDDLSALLEEGHELGCHTFAHCDSSQTKADVFEKSIVENRLALKAVCPVSSFKTFSYPISAPRPWTKRAAARHFLCARGGGQTFNSGTTDLNYLSAYFLEKSRETPDAVKKVIYQNSLARGWLICATHDVCEAPTAFGCTPGFFEDIVRTAVHSGARILPVDQALDALRNSR